MYFIQRLFNIDTKRMFSILDKIAKRSGKSKFFLFLDIINCAFRYGAGYMDYYVFNFEDLNAKQRKTYITRTINNNYIRKLNNREYYHVFDNKIDFLEKYKDYIKRDYLNLEKASLQEFNSFAQKHPIFIVKPVDGQCGYGVDIIDTNDKKIEDIYNDLRNKRQFLVEEKIVQNKELSDLYPCSINTIRIVTCLNHDEVNILYAGLRIGNNGKHVDNFNNGGMFSIIDDDGVIRHPAIDKEGIEYEIHPYTNTSIIGFKVPMFDEIIKECKKIARITPEVGLVGWDMCVSDEGIDIVEGNQFPGYDIYQSACHLGEDRIGLKPKFDKYIMN